MIKLINILSIDVALGALAMTLVWSYHFAVPFDWLHGTGLFLVVWLIYTIDHLMDVRSAITIVGQRYWFHQRYRKTLIVCSSIVCITLLSFLFWVDLTILFVAAITFIAAALHLWCNSLANKKQFFYPKEWVIGLVYTLGVSVSSVVYMIDHFGIEELSVLCLILTTAFLNIFLLSFFDVAADIAQGTNSIAIRLGTKKLEKRIFFLFILGLSLCFITLFYLAPTIVFAFLLIQISYLFIYYKRSFFARHERYRLFIDLAYSFPFLLLFIDK